MEKIKFKTSVTNIWLGIFFLIMSVLFECVAIWGFREDGRDGIIATVLLTTFFILPLAVVGIMAILSYFAQVGTGAVGWNPNNNLQRSKEYADYADDAIVFST